MTRTQIKFFIQFLLITTCVCLYTHWLL